MPQFDPSSFISQIFWLAICFSALYFSISRIFLPRIKSIIKAREENIKNNDLISKDLQIKIDEIEQSTIKLRDQSSLQYQMAMEQAVKQASLDRELALNNLRKKTDVMIDKSEQEIKQFIQNSKDGCGILVKNLIKVLSKKILDNNLTPEDLSILFNNNKQ